MGVVDNLLNFKFYFAKTKIKFFKNVTLHQVAGKKELIKAQNRRNF